MSGHDTALLGSEVIRQANGEALRILGLSYDRLTEKYTNDLASLTVWEDGTMSARARS